MESTKIADAFAKRKKTYLSVKIESLINDLIAAEFNASQLYKAMATWCEYSGYKGFACYFNKHTAEERAHMDKLYVYSLDRQCNPVTPAVKAQPTSFSDLKDVLTKALSHEELIESTYKNAIKIAMAESDMTTFNLFLWYLNEQIEEISKFSYFLDRLEVIGYDKKGMFFLDAELLDR